MELVKASQITDPGQRFLFQVANNFAVRTAIERLQPADSAVPITRSLEHFIAISAAQCFLNPNLGAYKNWPNEKVMVKLKMRFDLLPSAVREHKPTMALIKNKINKELTNNRAAAKALLLKSLGDFSPGINEFSGPYIPIVKLTNMLLSEICGASSKLTVTLPRVARVAFLVRDLILMTLRSDTLSAQSISNGGKVGSGFWDNVDTALRVVRETHKEDSIKITQVFTRILMEDRATYNDFESDENLDRLAEVLESGVEV
ncbi:hypothetical protein DFH05DRAFT_1460398 [Lentinula detonsa]|uniref:Uncharacterized protein n=1 Tax=Lentinula detonsa TaxID=2804962 RepID=A0A9W8P016_9AGAR|nr:hypothetical protein DFH05DRAFT_1460398 [Lentinula detonsa]